MMRVVERRAWLEGEDRMRCELTFEEPRTGRRYTVAVSPAVLDAHALGQEVALSARTPDGEC